MNKAIYTEKQKELLQIFRQGKLRRINILHGSVRSGKTWISLVLWAFWVATMPKSGKYLMVAKTLTSLKRNCLDLLEELVGRANFAYSLSQKQGQLFGRTIFLEGVNDARAESKIRGMTLTGAYCDELTLFTEDFFAMLLSRLSMENAKLFGTTNPDTPLHWLKVKYLDRATELDIFIMQFFIDDNTFLPHDYVNQLKSEYTGVFYDRFILGLWVVANGAIYRIFSDNPKQYATDKADITLSHDERSALLKYDFIQVGVDFGGNKSAHTFVATGISKDFSRLTALASERHEAKGLSPNDLYALFDKFIERVEKKYGKVLVVYADNAEQTLINGLRTHSSIPIKNSIKRPIIDRVRATTGLMSSGKFFLTGDCKTLSDAFQGAVYDDKKLNDTRLDNGTSDIDTLDAFEYSWEKYIKSYVRTME
ncbi:MAG: PBSX family phage terminase large subunit [Oscillospiraceae bacterium]